MFKGEYGSANILIKNKKRKKGKVKIKLNGNRINRKLR